MTARLGKVGGGGGVYGVACMRGTHLSLDAEDNGEGQQELDRLWPDDIVAVAGQVGREWLEEEAV